MFPNLMKIIKAQQTPNAKNEKKKNTPEHIIIKLLKTSDKGIILKAEGKKRMMYRETKIRTTVNFLSEITQARRE